MISSHRADRMRKRNARKGRVAPMNMISLMGIFTILVFFLLVNSAAVQTVPSAKALTLPEAFEETPPEETITVLITREQILVQGEAVMSVTAAENAPGRELPALVRVLEKQPLELYRTQDSVDTEARGELTILADKDTPYSLIRKVMQAGSETRFIKISLAVMQKTEAEEAGA